MTGPVGATAYERRVRVVVHLLNIAPTVHRFCIGPDPGTVGAILVAEGCPTGAKIANIGEKVESARLFHRSS
jgi:hypothetical protein